MAIYQLTGDPAHVSDQPFLILIVLTMPFVSWLLVRRGRLPTIVGAVLATLTTGFTIHSVSNAVRTGSYLVPNGPDYFYLSLAFAAGVAPWITIRITAASRKGGNNRDTHNSRLLPRWTLAATMIAVGLWFFPGSFDALVYNRELILKGQLWRVLTGHWVHFTGSHMLWNLVILVPTGVWLERVNGCALRRTLLLSPFAISLALLIFAPSLTGYAGISGVASAVLVALAVQGLRTEPRARWLWVGVLVLFLTKLGLEIFVRHPLNPELAAKGISSAPLAHIVGAVVGCLVVIATKSRPKLHT